MHSVTGTPSPAGFAGAMPARNPNHPRAWMRLLMLLALLSAVFVSLSAQAQEWRYRVRPGDTVWDLATTHMRQDVPWQKLQAHNRIADPAVLTPGSTLLFPVAWLRWQPAQAVVVAVNGAAVASRSGRFDDAIAVTPGLRLGMGAALRTPADASLSLRFADGSQLQLQGDSELHLDRLTAYGKTGMVDTRLRLPRGRATNSVRRNRGPGSHYIIETPGLMSSVRGTEFRVGTDGSRSRSEVVGGKVQVSGGGGSVLVAAGRGTATDASGKPARPVPLLPAPNITGWPARIDRMPATLAWPAVDGAASYRLQASTHADFRVLQQDEVIAATQARLRVRDEGEVFLRLRAISADGLEGLDATHAAVIAAQPAAPFVIAPVEGGQAAGPRPRLRWTDSDDDGLRYRVQVATDAGFAAPLAEADDLRRTEWRTPIDLPPGHYVWRVGATDASGKQGPWSDAIAFDLTAAAEGPGVEASKDDGTLRVRWPKAEDGMRYRFQLSRDAGFATTEIDRVLDDNAIDLPDLRSGTWHMRACAVESDGYEHAWGQTQVVKLGCLPCRILAGAGGAALLLLAL
ncbi:MAG: FecR domain-containing protein [Thermomonas sp.]|uniref:FecR domain-containing protein n=1 Tax=Thermomonas sp. TaxID=1971895 RepID=UPI0039E441CF